MYQRTPIAFAALAAFCCLLGSAAGENKSEAMLIVNVYYESLCPDSIYFITREFAPDYSGLKDFMKVNWIPFGKASWKVGSEGEPTHFTCQHGPNECKGNRAQACALHEIEQTLKPEDQQQKSVDVVRCVMASINPAIAVPQCAKQNGLSEQSIERIATCSTTNLGNELLIAHGEKTKAYESPLTFVPTVTVNGEKLKRAMSNFKGEICKLIPANVKPNVCDQQEHEER